MDLLLYLPAIIGGIATYVAVGRFHPDRRRGPRRPHPALERALMEEMNKQLHAHVIELDRYRRELSTFRKTSTPQHIPKSQPARLEEFTAFCDCPKCKRHACHPLRVAPKTDGAEPATEIVRTCIEPECGQEWRQRR
jgi:hypothetical protein